MDSRRVAPLASAKASTDGVDDGPVLSEALLPHAGGSSFVNPTIQAEIGNVFNQVDEDFDGKIDVADLRRAILFLLPSNRRKSGGGGGGGGGGGDGPDGAGGLEHPSPATARDVLDLAEELMSDWDADGDMRLTIGEFQTALESLLSQDYNQVCLVAHNSHIISSMTLCACDRVVCVLSFPPSIACERMFARTYAELYRCG